MTSIAAPTSATRTGKILSLQVGLVREMTSVDRDGDAVRWKSAIEKLPIDGPVRVGTLRIEGDWQENRKHHGGPDNVVLAYDAAHYPVWRRELQRPELTYGAFGENFTVTGFTDETVCLGDVWRVGDGLILQVTQPRQPCAKLARYLNEPTIVQRVQETGHGGWYLRVLQEGDAAAGMTIERIAQPHPEWPIATCVQVMYGRGKERAKAAELARLPELSVRWRRELGDE
jgi:MOSC domain-containing protein YiiM